MGMNVASRKYHTFFMDRLSLSSTILALSLTLLSSFFLFFLFLPFSCPPFCLPLSAFLSVSLNISQILILFWATVMPIYHQPPKTLIQDRLKKKKRFWLQKWTQHEDKLITDTERKSEAEERAIKEEKKEWWFLLVKWNSNHGATRPQSDMFWLSHW